MRVVLILRETGSDSPCRWFSPVGKYTGKAAYVERNQEMIKNSFYCICYYDENYAPPRRKNSRRDLFDYQPRSGTKVAYDFAVKKCGRVINVFQS